MFVLHLSSIRNVLDERIISKPNAMFTVRASLKNSTLARMFITGEVMITSAPVEMGVYL